MIAALVAKLESSKGDIRKAMTAAEEAAALREREWQEQQERWRREDDNRRVDQALVESQKQLIDIMAKWENAVAIRRFFLEAEELVAATSGDRRERLLERLTLARSMIGAADPLDFLEEWLAPEERYRSQYSRTDAD